MAKYEDPTETVRVRSTILRAIRLLKRLLVRSDLMCGDRADDMLISLSLIGRDVRCRRVDQVMDLDTVVVLKGEMTDDKYRIVDRVFSEVCNLAADDTHIAYMIADGPLKPLAVRKYNIFFHVILHTVSSYTQSPLILVKNSWQHEARLILGMPLNEVQYIPEPSIETVLSTPLGFAHCRQLAIEKGSAYLEWVRKNDRFEMELTPIHFENGCEVLEICYYSVLRCASNALRYVIGNSKGIGIDSDNLRAFSSVFSDFPDKDLPLEFLTEKEALRQDKLVITANLVERNIERTIRFIDALSEDLPCRQRISSPYFSF